MPRRLSLKQTRRWIALALLLLCTIVVGWRATSRVSAQTSTVIFGDNFDDNSRDTTKWNLGVLSQASSSFDSGVTVQESNSRLEITPLSRVKNQNFNGYVSVSSFNLTNAQATTEAVQVPNGSSTLAIFALAIDSNNWYRITANSSTISFQQKINGSTSNVNATYNSTQHHYWRIRHDATNGQIVFETSADAATWTARRTVATQLAITALRVELSGGTTASVTSPGTAIFDNLEIGRASCRERV